MTNLPYKGGFYEGSTAAQYVGRVKTVLEAGIGERWTVWKDAKKVGIRRSLIPSITSASREFLKVTRLQITNAVPWVLNPLLNLTSIWLLGTHSTESI